MNRPNSDPQGMIYLSDTVIHLENVVVIEVGISTESTGYVVVSFGLRDENNVIFMQEIRLNVDNNTIIIDENGRPQSLYNLREGMRVNVDFSSSIIRSIPLQSYAYRIVLLREGVSVIITTDRVVSVDMNNDFLTIGNPYDIYDQNIFTISNETVILDQNNNTIPLEAIQPGQMVRVEHAIFQTLGIPPQSPAFRVQIQ